MTLFYYLERYLLFFISPKMRKNKDQHWNPNEENNHTNIAVFINNNHIKGEV